MQTLTSPYCRETISSLKVGEMVLISGKLFTGRDAVHKKLCDGASPPVELRDQILYHCGPVVVPGDQGEYRVLAAGPTTSIREEPYQWKVMRDHGILGVIGKGGMGQRTLEACQEYGCVYLHAIGGAAQVLAQKILSVENVYWKDLGFPEAIWELSVEGFPVVVTMDAHGNSLHKDVEGQSAKALKALLNGET